MKIDSPTLEPSMDEILASIRHIVSSDGGDEGKRFPPPKLDGDILDLTNLLPDEKIQIKNAAQRTASLQNKRVSPSLEEKTKPSAPSPGESLLSSKAASETTQTLNSLTKLVQGSSSSQPIKTSQSVESLVRELLKPLLKEWLDENLPRLVQWIVTEQVEKIVNQMNAPSSGTYNPNRTPPSRYD